MNEIQNGANVRETFRKAVEQVLSLGLHLVQIAVVFFVAAMIGRACRRLVRRQMTPTMVPSSLERIVEQIVTFLVLAVGATILLTHWGVTWTTLLTAIGVSTLVIALGLQNVLQSVIAGLFILIERPYNVGDRVRFANQNVAGTVEAVAWRTTVIHEEGGTRTYVPNAVVLTSAVTNFSPELSGMTVVTVHSAGDNNRTLAETIDLAELALKDIVWPASPAEIHGTSRLELLLLSPRVARTPGVGPLVDRWIRELVAETTRVSVNWTGKNDPATRQLVIDQLRGIFGTSRITIRRW